MEIRKQVSVWCDAEISRASNFSLIPLPISAQAVWGSVKHTIGTYFTDFKMAIEVATVSAKEKISRLTGELTGIQVTDVNSYRDGASGVTSIDATKSLATQSTVVDHINELAQRTKSLLAAAPGMMREMIIAIAVAIVLTAISAAGVILPLLIGEMGANKSLGDIEPIAMAIIISAGLAFSTAAINLTFFKGKTMRLAPWFGWVIGFALVVLTGRYISSAAGADYFLMETLPRPWPMIIRIISVVGIGIALICVEIGSGRALAFAWVRITQRGDLVRLREIESDIDTWHAARIEWEAQSRNQGAAIRIDDLCRTGAQMIVGAIDEHLEEHRNSIREYDGHVDQPWVGSKLEHLDMHWLKTQVSACESARDELLRLAGLNAPIPASSTLPVPTSPQSNSIVVNPI